MNLTIDGRQVQYLDKGEGPTLLFLHGWAAPVETYRLLTDHLSGYCRVVAPDFPGFGGSEEPPVPWDVDGYVDFTLKFAAALGIERAVLMGHSFGGRVIIKLMNRPGPPLEVPKIILMDAAGIKPPRPFSACPACAACFPTRWKRPVPSGAAPITAAPRLSCAR